MVLLDLLRVDERQSATVVLGASDDARPDATEDAFLPARRPVSVFGKSVGRARVVPESDDSERPSIPLELPDESEPYIPDAVPSAARSSLGAEFADAVGQLEQLVSLQLEPRSKSWSLPAEQRLAMVEQQPAERLDAAAASLLALEAREPEVQEPQEP